MRIFSIFFAFLFTAITAISQTTETKGWPSSERASFIAECIKSAKAGMSEDSARSYCYCMQSKIETKYPNAEDAGKLTAADMQTPAWKKEIVDCLGAAKWSASYRASFLSGCVDEAKKSFGEEKAKKYCECMVFKVESRFPNPKDADNITAETIKTPEWQKVIRDCLAF